MNHFQKQHRYLKMQTKANMAAHAAVFATVLLAALQAWGAVGNAATAPWTQFVLLAGLLGVAHLAGQRSTWLPFLGATVMPPTVFQPRLPIGATIPVDVHVDAKAVAVVYWAADKNGSNPHVAYNPWKNSGVAQVSCGTARLMVRCPGVYKVRGKLLPRHVHYREIYANGMCGPVRTTAV